MTNTRRCHDVLDNCVSAYGSKPGDDGLRVHKGQNLNNNANIIRYGDPNSIYSNGYFRYYNGYGQPLNPATGTSAPNSLTHITQGYVGPLIGCPGSQ